MCIVLRKQVNKLQYTQFGKKSVYGVEIDVKLVEGVKSGCRLFGLQNNYRFII